MGVLRVECTYEGVWLDASCQLYSDSLEVLCIPYMLDWVVLLVSYMELRVERE
jgi:hypothetical protein